MAGWRVIAIPKQKRKPINWGKIGQSVKGGFESVASGGSKIIDIATKAGVAYVGFNALKHPAGALTGLVALNLANSPNLAAGVAGVATLTALGAMSTIPPGFDPGDYLPYDPCPIPPTAFLNPIAFLAALAQRQICLASQPPVDPIATGMTYVTGGGYIAEP